MATNTDAAQPPAWRHRLLVGRDPSRTVRRAAVLAVLGFVLLIVFKFVLLPIRVEGVSMLPTYREKSFNLVNRLAYLFHPPRRGDVVAIRLRAGNHILYLKRVVGLPGETVAFHRGQVYINGHPLDEPYVVLRGTWEHEPEPVGPDQYYVVGDNRDMPWDYHEKGRPTRDLILGKVLL